MKENASYLQGYLFLVLMMAVILSTSPAIGAILRVPSQYQTIQQAINAASVGDTVLVANGVFTGEGNKDLDFQGKAITAQSEEGPQNCIIDCEGTGRGFRFHNGEGQDSLISGFTITNGAPTDAESNPVDGGGILCDSASSPTITDCIISGNYSRHGGGVYCQGSSPTITNCTISGNETNYHGAAVRCYWDASPTITNCTITDNVSHYNAAGIHSYWGSSPTITNCTITNNLGEAYGGGVLCQWDASATVTNCIISGNYAPHGGGVCCLDGSSITMTNCIISGNVASATSAYNGGGGIQCRDSSSATVTNCTFSVNAAYGSGGGIRCWQSSSVTVINSILWGDTAAGSPNEVDLTETDSIDITYSDVEGGWIGDGNINSNPLFFDPRPASEAPTSAGDYHLAGGSPCIDVGYNAAQDIPPSDFEGDDRIIDGDGDAIAIVDMGADEYLPPGPCTDLGGDTDDDGICDDGDGNGTPGDNPCTGGETENCDDNCPDTPNPDQLDCDSDGIGNVCEDALCECKLVRRVPATLHRGDTLKFRATVCNNTDQTGSVLFGTKLTYPQGGQTGWIIGPSQVGLAPYESKSKEYTHTIPMWMPFGLHTYRGYVGNYGAGIYDECLFYFHVVQE